MTSFIIGSIFFVILAKLAYDDIAAEYIPFPSAFETMNEYRAKYLRNK